MKIEVALSDVSGKRILNHTSNDREVTRRAIAAIGLYIVAVTAENGATMNAKFVKS